jgi:hypothetical protein
MNPPAVDRDERVVMVENASYRWAYLALSFGLLVDIFYRSAARGESAWDLFLLVLLGGAVTTVYQRNNQVLSRRSTKMTVFAVILGAVVALLFMLVRR